LPLVGDRTDLGHAKLAPGGAQPAVDVPGVGAEGDPEARPVPVEQGLELCLEHRLADPGGAQLHVGLALEDQAKAGKARDHLLREHRPELVGRARHHAEHFAVLLDPEARGGAVRIGEHLAPLETVGLLQVVRGHLAPEERKPVQDVPLNRGIEYQLLAEDACDRLPGAVVAGGTEAARDEDHIRALPTLPELRRNVLGVIRYRHVPLQLDPARA